MLFSWVAWWVSEDLSSTRLAVHWLLEKARSVFDSTSDLCSCNLTPVFFQNQTGLPGGSKKQCTSERKVNEPWIKTRAVINSVTSMTAFLMWHSIVASSLRRTEYQLLLMKISVRDHTAVISIYKFFEWNSKITAHLQTVPLFQVKVNNVFGWVLMNFGHHNKIKFDISDHFCMWKMCTRMST